MDLFTHQNQSKIQEDGYTPLAARLRPDSFAQFVGQGKIAGTHKSFLSQITGAKSLPNLILWGPPGTGKTSFALLLSQRFDFPFVSVNAIDTGAKQLRELGDRAHVEKLQYSRPTLLFIDEIHRLNRSQQDVLLPFTERGDLVLVGATTENPSYELNAALLSRCRVLVFEKLYPEELQILLLRAAEVLKIKLTELLQPETQKALLRWADGDARQLLNGFDQIYQAYQASLSPERGEDAGLTYPLDEQGLQALLDVRPIYYDKSADEHYDCISAFIKSIRGSDPDAGLYYLARMLEGGESPVFIARRLVVLASEDVGNADPRALSIAVAGLQAVELVGLPEAAINLAQVTTYLASAPKSNRSYMGLRKAQEEVRKSGRLPVPKALRSSRTALNKEMGYGKGYKYSHDGPKAWLEQEFLPSEIVGKKFYEPSERGFEKNILNYLQWLKSPKSES